MLSLSQSPGRQGSHQLGVIDIYHFNVPARLCQVKLEDGRLLREVHREKAEQRTWQRGLMCGGNIPQTWEEIHAIALNRDYGLVLGTVILYVVIILILNLIVDLVYAWLDPKVRYR